MRLGQERGGTGRDRLSREKSVAACLRKKKDNVPKGGRKGPRPTSMYTKHECSREKKGFHFNGRRQARGRRRQGGRTQSRGRNGSQGTRGEKRLAPHEESKEEGLRRPGKKVRFANVTVSKTTEGRGALNPLGMFVREVPRPNNGRTEKMVRNPPTLREKKESGHGPVRRGRRRGEIAYAGDHLRTLAKAEKVREVKKKQAQALTKVGGKGQRKRT